jgi:hypothetical protein
MIFYRQHNGESLSASQIKNGFVSGSDVHNSSKTASDNAKTVHYIAYPSHGSNMESNLCSRLSLHIKFARENTPYVAGSTA